MKMKIQGKRKLHYRKTNYNLNATRKTQKPKNKHKHSISQSMQRNQEHITLYKQHKKNCRTQTAQTNTARNTIYHNTKAEKKPHVTGKKVRERGKKTN